MKIRLTAHQAIDGRACGRQIRMTFDNWYEAQAEALRLEQNGRYIAITLTQVPR